MWSVKYLPNPGSRKIDSRSASVAGVDERETVNSSEPVVMAPIVSGRANAFLPRAAGRLAGFQFDERRAHHFALGSAAADVDGDVLAILDSGIGVDQRQRDADLQRRREGSRGGDPDGGVAGQHRLPGTQHAASDHP